MNHDIDGRAVARESLVNRVVDHFVYQVVKTLWPGGSDIHTGALPNSLESF
jgi:hypothetical protein